MTAYDAPAALEVLGTYAEQRDPSTSASLKANAATNLLNQVAALDGKMIGLAAGVASNYRQLAVEISLGFADVRVTYLAEKFLVFNESNARIEVPIRYNRARDIFEGEELDNSYVPTPGAPRERRRDALVVLAEAIIAMMNRDQ